MDNGHQSPVTHPEPEVNAQAAKTPQPPAPSKRRRLFPPQLLPILAGLGLTGLIVYALRPQPIAVDLSTVDRGDLQVTVEEEGETRVRDRFVIAAPVEGRLLRIDLDEGDAVEPGMLVAQIDPLPYTTQVQEAQARLRELQAQLAGVETQRPKPAALEQARSRIAAAQAAQQESEARVAQAEAAFEQAQRDRQRFEQLYTEGAIPQQDFEAAQLEETVRARELDMAQEQLRRAIAEVNAAQENLAILQAEQRDPDYLLEVYRAQIAAVKADLADLTDEARRTEIFAPAAGQVLRVLQESARYVTAGTPLLEVGNASSLELVIDILSTEAVKVEPGDPILIEHWGGEHTLQARVRYVEPSAFTEVSALGVEEQRVNVIADFAEPAIPLGDGYRVEARIVVWQDSQVLKVPVSALFRCKTDWCTFVVDRGRARRRKVRIGPRSDFEAVVNDGLEAGETVILHPTEQIEDGKRVSAR